MIRNYTSGAIGYDGKPAVKGRVMVRACAAAALAGAAMSAHAGVITVPDSALVPSTQLYTDTIGGGIGHTVVMTDGGNAPGIGDPSGRNDDGFSGPINLGFTLNFFGTDYNAFFANNNGNISFNGGIAAFTPEGPQGATQPVISPFFADVDTRNTDSGVMYVRTDIPNEVIVTWNGVGYFNSQADKLDTFQLVVRGPEYSVPAGQGAIGFFYTGMNWEVGGASGGVGGFCPSGTVGSSCFPAAVGFGDGASNGEILQGSLQAGISSIVNDTHIWFNQNLTPVTPPSSVPAPGTLALMGLGFAGLGVFRRRKAK